MAQKSSRYGKMVSYLQSAVNVNSVSHLWRKQIQTTSQSGMNSYSPQELGIILFYSLYREFWRKNWRCFLIKCLRSSHSEDKAHFHLCGDFNEQNYHFWNTENPCIIHELLNGVKFSLEASTGINFSKQLLWTVSATKPGSTTISYLNWMSCDWIVCGSNTRE